MMLYIPVPNWTGLLLGFVFGLITAFALGVYLLGVYCAQRMKAGEHDFRKALRAAGIQALVRRGMDQEPRSGVNGHAPE